MMAADKGARPFGVWRGLTQPGKTGKGRDGIIAELGWQAHDDEAATARKRRSPALSPRGLLARLRGALAAEEDRYGLWLPVAFAAGAGGYFALPTEPSGLAVVAGMAAALAMLAAMAWRRRSNWVMLLAVFVLIGAGMGKARVAMVDTRLLQATTGTAMLTGVVREGERQSGRWRLVLDLENVDGVKPEASPRRIRLTMPASSPVQRGERIKVLARLYPLRGPVAPGTWNPGRDLWFDGIGATGYTIGKPETLGPAGSGMAGGFSHAVQDLRDAIAGRIRKVLASGTAGMAIALIVGERGEIPSAARDNLRAAGLAHILAISGLHLSLVAGGLFWVVRALLALSPWLAAEFAIKKWSVLAALLGAGGYLVLSGAAVATQRAFVMLAVMTLAVLLDRPAISMRNLAVAAFVVMITSPEAVTGASFQMSFLAVASLIAFYEAVTAWRQAHSTRKRAYGPAWRLVRWAGLFVFATAATTLVAGTATSLPAAFHFHRVSLYSLAANVLGLPLVSLLVMPAAVLAVFAMPFGLEAGPLWLMGTGIEGVLRVAAEVAAMPGSSRIVPAMPAAVALIMAFGILWLALWRGRVRLLGLVIFAAGAALAPLKAAPDVLVDRFAGVVALRNADGALVPSSGRKARYVVGQWLLADGDGASPAKAARREGWNCDKAACRGEVQGRSIIYLLDDKSQADCGGRDIVIAAFPLRGRCGTAAVRIDRFDVWRSGAQAIFVEAGGMRIETAAQGTGARPWNVTPVARRTIRTAPLSAPRRGRPASSDDKPDRESDATAQ